MKSRQAVASRHPRHRPVRRSTPRAAWKKGHRSAAVSPWWQQPTRTRCAPNAAPCRRRRPKRKAIRVSKRSARLAGPATRLRWRAPSPARSAPPRSLLDRTPEDPGAATPRKPPAHATGSVPSAHPGPHRSRCPVQPPMRAAPRCGSTSGWSRHAASTLPRPTKPLVPVADVARREQGRQRHAGSDPVRQPIALTRIPQSTKGCRLRLQERFLSSWR